MRRKKDTVDAKFRCGNVRDENQEIIFHFRWRLYAEI
jgi:hypothetical protein